MKKGTVFFLGLAAGAILALVFVTAVLAVASWKFGFFSPRSAPAPTVAVRAEPAISPAHPPTPVLSALPVTALEPVLHLQSQNLNLLDGKFPITAGDAQVQRGDGYLVVSDAAKLRIAGALTVSVWFKPRYFNKPMALGSRALNGPPWQYPYSSWLMRLNNDQLLEASLAGSGNYSPSTWLVPDMLPGQWYHAVLTYDGQTKMLFLNGARQTRLNSGNASHAQGIANTPGHPIMIGADESLENPDAEKFDGAIDDVQLFNRALTEEEDRSTYSAGVRRYGVNQ